MKAVHARRRRRLRLMGVALGGAGLVTVALVSACASDTPRVAAGQECFAASDCQPGLVCVPDKNGRICSSDLTGVQGRPPAEAGAADAGDASTDAATDAPATPDAPVVQDTGTGIDTGIIDAGDAG